MQQHVKMMILLPQPTASLPARCGALSGKNHIAMSTPQMCVVPGRSPRAETRSRRYVRVKRKTTTIFLNVEKSDSFGGVKQKIGEIIDARRPRGDGVAARARRSRAAQR